MRGPLIPVSNWAWQSPLSSFCRYVASLASGIQFLPHLQAKQVCFPKSMGKKPLLIHHINRPTTTKIKKEKLPSRPPLVSWTVSLGSNFSVLFPENLVATFLFLYMLNEFHKSYILIVKTKLKDGKSPCTPAAVSVLPRNEQIRNRCAAADMHWLLLGPNSPGHENV